MNKIKTMVTHQLPQMEKLSDTGQAYVFINHVPFTLDIEQLIGLVYDISYI